MIKESAAKTNSISRFSHTEADLGIVESVEFLDEDKHREGEILARTLRLAGKNPTYTYLRTADELESYFKEFGLSNYRYLHLSCHGSNNQFFTTVDPISSIEMAGYIGKHLKDRRLFVSACLVTEKEFAEEVMMRGGCHSVLGPAGAISFEDAAIFWTAFYYRMFKSRFSSMTNDVIEENLKICAKIVDFPFFFYYKKAGKMKEYLVG